MLVFLSANVVTRVAAVGTDRLDRAHLTENSIKFNHFVSRLRFVDSCEVQTSGDNLLVRSVPGGSVIGRLRNGSSVNVKDRWTKISVRLKGRTITGWVASRFLNEGYVETDGDNLNVRTVPLNGAIVGKLPNSTLVQTLDIWSRIAYKDGWVSSEFLGNCS